MIFYLTDGERIVLRDIRDIEDMGDLEDLEDVKISVKAGGEEEDKVVMDTRASTYLSY